MKVELDPEACLGCGLCETIAPQVFRLGDEGFAVILLDIVEEQYRDLVQQAADECSEDAISIMD